MKDSDFKDITFRVHKDMTPEKYRDNCHDEGMMGTDFDGHRLVEHVFELAHYYGLGSIESIVEECKHIVMVKS